MRAPPPRSSNGAVLEILPPPRGLSIATATLVNPLMARYAERHQIALIMCASLRNRSDMMHECRKDVSPPFFALLAERMPCQMTITNPAPRAAIPLVLIVPTREMVIVSLHNFFVRLAVAAFSICKIRTARHAAGALRFSRHHFTSITA